MSFDSPPPAATGTTGQIEAARAALHAWGITGNNLAEETQVAAERIYELTKVANTRRVDRHGDAFRALPDDALAYGAWSVFFAGMAVAEVVEHQWGDSISSVVLALVIGLFAWTRRDG